MTEERTFAFVQLELSLGDRCLEEPWGGRSPRELTEAWKRFKFSPVGGKRGDESKDSMQLDLFLPRSRGRRRKAPSAPSLLPLPRRLR